MPTTHSINNILNGISSVPAIARQEGFCEDEVNWFNDPRRGITRRTSSRLIGEPTALNGIVSVITSESFKDTLTYLTFVLGKSTTNTLILYLFKGNGIVPETIYNGLPAGWSIDDSYRMFYFDGNMYLVNTDVDVQVTSTVVNKKSFGTSGGR